VAVYGVATFINHHSFMGVITPWNIRVHLRHDPLSGTGCYCFWLTNALWFGPLFFLYSGRPAPGQRSWVALRGLGFSLLFAAAFFTMMGFYLLFPPYTLRWEIFLLVGMLLTIASWFRAEALAKEQLGGLRTVTGKQQAEALSGQMTDRAMEIIGRPFTGGRAAGGRCVDGPGGLRFLFQMIFYPMFGQGLAMVLVFGLLFFRFVTRSGLGNDNVANDNDVPVSAFWMVVSFFLWLAVLLVLPKALPSTRWLRTLPVSAAQLAGVLIGAPLAAMLAFMALGNVILGLVYPLSQLPLPALLHQGCLLQMALAMGLVPLFLWRGTDAPAIFLAMLLLVIGATNSVHIQQDLSLPENLGAALLLVLVNFGLTQWLLARNSRVYRPRPGAGVGLTWFGSLRG